MKIAVAGAADCSWSIQVGWLGAEIFQEKEQSCHEDIMEVFDPAQNGLL
jgi:hypothetical protein